MAKRVVKKHTNLNDGSQKIIKQIMEQDIMYANPPMVKKEALN